MKAAQPQTGTTTSPETAGKVKSNAISRRDAATLSQRDADDSTGNGAHAMAPTAGDERCDGGGPPVKSAPSTAVRHATQEGTQTSPPDTSPPTTDALDETRDARQVAGDGLSALPKDVEAYIAKVKAWLLKHPKKSARSRSDLARLVHKKLSGEIENLTPDYLAAAMTATGVKVSSSTVKKALAAASAPPAGS